MDIILDNGSNEKLNYDENLIKSNIYQWISVR